MRIRAGRGESSASTTAAYKLADGATLFLERIYYISGRSEKNVYGVCWGVGRFFVGDFHDI